ncbi:MAG: hypothetical protein KGO53_14285 [Alphaproteobacteria bacterium]|nr:hypothetical protein [Alphaproteobacteria bacterium]
MSKNLLSTPKLALAKAARRMAIGLAAAGMIAGLSAQGASAHGFIYGGGYGGVLISVGGGYWHPHHFRVCPYGMHLGYNGVYCWPNRVIY